MKILIGIPLHDFEAVGKEKAASTTKLIEAFPDIEFETRTIKGSYLDTVRNDLVQSAIDLNADYFLSTDNDILFKPDVLTILLKRNLPIVFGAFKYKAFDEIFACGTFKEGFPGDVEEKRFPSTTRGLIEGHWCGLGLFLAKIEALKNIERPWFGGLTYKKANGTVDSANDSLSFCLRLTQKEYKIYIDCDVNLNHRFEKSDKEILKKRGYYTLTGTRQFFNEVLRLHLLPKQRREQLLKNISSQII